MLRFDSPNFPSGFMAFAFCVYVSINVRFVEHWFKRTINKSTAQQYNEIGTLLIKVLFR